MSISSFSLFLLILALPFYRTSAAAAEVAAGSDLFNPIQLPSNYGLTSALVSSTSAESGNLCPDTVVDPGSCPVKCFRADPVCGADGITYWCGCAEAICGGARVAKMGFCEVGNGGSGPVSGQALLLVHILWLILLGFFVLFGLL